MKLKYLKYLFIISLIFYLILIPFSITQYPKYDESDYPLMVKFIHDKGIPLYYGGKDPFFVPSLWQKADNNLIMASTHPTLYTHILSWIPFKLGENYIVIRIVHIIFNFLTLFLIYLILKEIFINKKKKKKIQSIFFITASLYLISPFFLQKSLELSFDALLPFFLSLFIYFFFKFYKTNNKYQDVYLGILFALAFWIKETTPLFLIISIFIFYLLKFDLKKSFKRSFLIFFIGITLFSMTWILYCIIKKFPIFIFFLTTFVKREFVVFNIRQILKIFYDFFWFLPPFVILLILAVLGRIKLFIKLKKIKLFDFIVIFSITTWLIYSIKAPLISYKFPLFIFFCLIISSYIYHLKFKIIKRLDYVFYLILILVLFIFYLSLPDILILFPNILPIKNNFLTFLYPILLYLVPIVLIPIIIIFLKKKESLIKKIVISMLILLIPMILSLNIKQATADYSVITNYGEKGFDQTINYLKSKINKNDTIICFEDIATALDHKNYFMNVLTKKGYGGNIIPLWKVKQIFSNNISYIIYSDYYLDHLGGLNKETEQQILINYYLEKKFGNYYIFKKIKK